MKQHIKPFLAFTLGTAMSLAAIANENNVIYQVGSLRAVYYVNQKTMAVVAGTQQSTSCVESHGVKFGETVMSQNRFRYLINACH